MLKLAFVVIVLSGISAISPALAETSAGGSGIGRGCTLDPFNHTMRCIDFDHCTTDSSGRKTCPVVVTPTKAERRGAAQSPRDYPVAKEEALAY